MGISWVDEEKLCICIYIYIHIMNHNGENGRIIAFCVYMCFSVQIGTPINQWKRMTEGLGTAHV